MGLINGLIIHLSRVAIINDIYLKIFDRRQYLSYTNQFRYLDGTRVMATNHCPFKYLLLIMLILNLGRSILANENHFNMQTGQAPKAGLKISIAGAGNINVLNR